MRPARPHHPGLAIPASPSRVPHVLSLLVPEPQRYLHFSQPCLASPLLVLQAAVCHVHPAWLVHTENFCPLFPLGNHLPSCPFVSIVTGGLYFALQLTTLRGAILEDAVPSTARHGTARGLPLKEVLEYVIPELSTQCLRQASSSPKVSEQLLKLDEQGVCMLRDTGLCLLHERWSFPIRLSFNIIYL